MNAFGRALGRLHRVGMRRLSDSVAVYQDRNGAVIADELSVMVDHAVERMDSIHGFDHWTTIGLVVADVERVDRQGSFLVQGKTWHIDGVASDDGHVISFYVRK